MIPSVQLLQFFDVLNNFSWESYENQVVFRLFTSSRLIFLGWWIVFNNQVHVMRVPFVQKLQNPLLCHHWTGLVVRKEIEEDCRWIFHIISRKVLSYKLIDANWNINPIFIIDLISKVCSTRIEEEEIYSWEDSQFCGRKVKKKVFSRKIVSFGKLLSVREHFPVDLRIQVQSKTIINIKLVAWGISGHGTDNVEGESEKEVSNRLFSALI